MSDVELAVSIVLFRIRAVHRNVPGLAHIFPEKQGDNVAFDIRRPNDFGSKGKPLSLAKAHLVQQMLDNMVEKAVRNA
jgi:hypothetical protein